MNCHGIKNKEAVMMLYRLRSHINKRFIVVTVIIATLTYFTIFKVVDKAYYLTLAHPVPSGDDVATHIYLALKLVEDPSNIVFVKRFNYTSVTLHYPNIVHVFMALLYALTKDLLLLVSFIKLYSFSLITLGFFLYSYVIYKCTDLSNKGYRIAITFAFLALASILSRGVLSTLSDGSIMELTVILILVPLSLLAFLNNKYYLAGITIGLASLNILGFAEIIAILLPWLIFLLLGRQLRHFAKLLIGVLIGGNFFLARIMYKLIFSFLNIGSVSVKPIEQISIAPNPMNVISDIYGNILLFYLYLSVFGLTVLILVVFKRRFRRELFIASSWIFHTLLMFLTPYLVPMVAHSAISGSVIYRFARINLFLASLTITMSFHMIFMPLLRSKSKIFISVLNKTEPTYIASIRTNELGLYLLVFILILMCILSVSISPVLYESINQKKGLIRINNEQLKVYLRLRSMFLNSNLSNVIILDLNQVGAWLRTFLTIPERKIEVFLIAPPDVYMRYSPDDPNRIVGLTLYNALMKMNLSLLKKFNTAYIAVELPNKKQWYHISTKTLAYELWSKDFRPIANLVFEYYSKSSGKGLRLWKLKDRPSIELNNVSLKPGDFIIYHGYDLLVGEGGYIAIQSNRTDIGQNLTILGIAKPHSWQGYLYIIRKGYNYWLRFKDREVQLAFVSKGKTYVDSVTLDVLGTYLVNGSILHYSNKTIMVLSISNTISSYVVRLLNTSAAIAKNKAYAYVGCFPTAKGIIENGTGMIRFSMVYCNDDVNINVSKFLTPKLIVVHDHNYMMFEPSFIYMHINNPRNSLLENILSKVLGVNSYFVKGNITFTSSTPFLYVISFLNASNNNETIKLIGFPIGSIVVFQNMKLGLEFKIAVEHHYEEVKIKPGTYNILVYSTKP